MKKIIIFIIVLFSLSQSAFAGDWGKLSPYLPANGVIKGDIIKRVPQEKAEKIGAKFFSSIQSKRKWFAEYIKDKDRSKPLTYHSNFGLTEEEYEIFLQLSRSENSVAFEKTGEVELVFTKTPDGDIIISSRNTDFPLNKLHYFVNKNVIESKYGVHETFSEIDRGPDKQWRPYEGWTGISWRRNVLIGSFGDEDLGPYLLFGIGKIKDKNSGIIFYEAVHVGKAVKEPFIIEFQIEYPLNS